MDMCRSEFSPDTFVRRNNAELKSMARRPWSIWVLLLFTVTYAQSARYNDSGCLSTFWTDRKRFDVCREHLCFLFKFEEPFVFRNDKLAKQPSRPFPCHLREELYSGLDGLFFDLLNRVAIREGGQGLSRIRNAYCVYSGDDCSFNGMVRFLDSAVRSGGGYRFIAGGYLIFLPNRRMNNTQQSNQVYAESMVLLHRRRYASHSFRSALRNVFGPFGARGWAVGASFSTILCIVAVVFGYWFSESTNHDQPYRLTWLINGVPGVNAEQQVAWRLLVTTNWVFVTMVILLYEVAIALYIFRAPEPPLKGFSQLASLGLERFGVVKDAASETILRILVDKQGLLNDTTIPWKRMAGFKEKVGALRRQEINYIFTFKQNVKFQLHQMNLCHQLSVTPLNVEAVGGWYYSIDVPLTIRTRIDTVLSTMWIAQETMNDLNRFEQVPLDCGLTSNKVDHSVLIILLGFFVFPLLLATIIAIIKAKYFAAAVDSRINAAREEDNCGRETSTDTSK